ncbi:Pxl1p LALA0_S09e04324g [Lachancea lanzarotensis]|uniref:LALA0S09e04324g1_1 n=1 Tax=Lachancea lanzarotensis TaxID=1245769 RepID=A0A0C7NDU1_9SACH|nr:uncharacterized protein LALA0_S09e04324g [Lachancea lanzarotensis]CEP63869.1 LALA0S09e04324g1_1 [Lachancea lanzarotensis]
MQGSIYSSPFPALNPRVRYKTALERAGFDVYHNRTQREREPNGPNGPYMNQRHVSEGGGSPFGVHSEPSLAPAQQNNRNRAVSAREAQPASYSWKTPDLPHEHFSSPQFHDLERTGLPGRDFASQSRLADHNDRSKEDNGVDQAMNMASNGSVKSRASRQSGAIRQRDSSVFDFEHKRTSVDPVEKSFLQLTQTSNESDRSSQERGFTPYEVDSATSAAVSDDDFEDAHSQSVSTGEVPGMAKWRSIMRYSEATHEPVKAAIPEDHELNATPNSKRLSESSISFTPVAELHVRLSPQKPPSTVPVISVTNEDEKYTSSSQSDVDDLGNTDERSLKSLDIEPEHSLISPVQQSPQQPHQSEKEAFQLIQEEIEEMEDDFDPSSTLKSSLQVERLLAQLDNTSTNRNLAVGSPRPELGSRFKKSSAYLSGFVPATVSTDIDDALQPNPILQNEARSDELSQDNALKFEPQTLRVKTERIISPLQNNSPHDPDASRGTEVLEDSALKYKPQTINVQTERTIAALQTDSPQDSDGSPMFFKFRQDLGPTRRVSSDGEAADAYPDALRPSERLEQSLQTPVSLRQRDVNAIKKEVAGSGNKDASDASVPRTAGETKLHSHKFPPGQGPCRACGLEVKSKSIFSKKENELSGQWHRPCFRCIKCDVKFSKHVPCYILDDDPYCQLHYHTANNSICQICYKFIEGECLENDRDERFHAACLRCFRCQEFIREDYYLFNNELPLCYNHDIDALKLEALSEFGDTTTISKRRTRIVNFS